MRGAPSATASDVVALAGARSSRRGHVHESRVLVGRLGPAGVDPAHVQLRIGSMTKHLTAALAMLLDEDGTFPLAERLSTWFPGVGAEADRDCWDVLTHTAGLPAEVDDALWTTGAPPSREAVAAAAARRLPLPPGAFHYSNLGYGLYGEALRRAAGRSWWSLLEERVLRPAGMRATTLAPTQDHVRGWYLHGDGRPPAREAVVDLGALAPAGQLWSTVGDLLAWFDVLDDGGRSSPDRFRTFTRPRVPRHGSAQALAGEVRDGRLLLGGLVPGYSSAGEVRLGDGSAAVVLANASNPPGAEALLDELLDGVAERPAVVAPRLGEAWPPPGLLGRWWLDGSAYRLVRPHPDDPSAALRVLTASGRHVADLLPERVGRDGGSARSSGLHAGELLTWSRAGDGLVVTWSGYPLRRGEGPLLPEAEVDG